MTWNSPCSLLLLCWRSHRHKLRASLWSDRVVSQESVTISFSLARTTGWATCAKFWERSGVRTAIMQIVLTSSVLVLVAVKIKPYLRCKKGISPLLHSLFDLIQRLSGWKYTQHTNIESEGIQSLFQEFRSRKLLSLSTECYYRLRTKRDDGISRNWEAWIWRVTKVDTTLCYLPE